MAKEKKAKKNVSEGVLQYPNGQEAHLRKLRKQAIIVIGTGVFWLLMCILSSVLITIDKDAQIGVTNALNQYRVASRTLTLSIQSYAVTGDAQYLDAYNKEVSVDMNRDKAIETLQTYDIKSWEWDKLNQIATLSNGLIEYENAAIAGVEAGNMDWARDQVFSTAYEDGVAQITVLTDEVIDEILTRKDKGCNMLEAIQYVCIIIFVLSVVAVLVMFMKVIKFAGIELLEPPKHWI